MLITAGSAELPLDHRFERLPGLPYWTLSLNVTGGARNVSSEHDEVGHAPCIGLIRPNTPYVVTFGGKGKRWFEYWTIFSPMDHWHALLDWQFAGRGICFASLPTRAAVKEIEAAFKQLIADRNSSSSAREELGNNSLHRVLLLCSQWAGSGQQQPRDDRVRDAIDLMMHCLDQPLTVRELAEHVHVSESHFTHLFKEQTGESAMAMFERLRLQRASERLLSTNDPIAEVAEAVGFANAFHFSTRFRKQFGVSPRSFRKKPGALALGKRGN